MDIKEDNVGTNTILHYAERELAQMAHEHNLKERQSAFEMLYRP
jgi:hypothetical protein